MESEPEQGKEDMGMGKGVTAEIAELHEGEINQISKHIKNSKGQCFYCQRREL